MKIYITIHTCFTQSWQEMIKEKDFATQQELNAFKQGVLFFHQDKETEINFFDDYQECESYCKQISGQADEEEEEQLETTQGR